MYHPEVYYMLARQRQSDILAQAQRRRLIRAAQAGQPTQFQRVLLALGERLIGAGERLKAAYPTTEYQGISCAQCID